MKLIRAIEILTMFVEGRWPGPSDEFDDAANLLIEAGKRIKLQRSPAGYGHSYRLQGETMEADDA